MPLGRGEGWRGGKGGGERGRSSSRPVSPPVTPTVGEDSAGSVEGEGYGELKLVHKVVFIDEREEVIIVIHVNN